MAKNLTKFQPGAQTASADLKYKTIIMTGMWGPDMNGCAPDTSYGNNYYYVDRKRHTFCGGSMQKGTLSKGGTDTYMFGGGGQSAGACCCQQSTPGRNGPAGKYSPRWVGDSDHIYYCAQGGCGCCMPQCAGTCSNFAGLCHTSGGHGGTNVQCIRTQSGCGAASVCNYIYQNCCNYGAEVSSGGWKEPCCRACVEATCYTCCKTEVDAACDAGYDCVECRGIGHVGFESGSCINRESSGICGKPMWGSYHNWKNSGFRMGTVMFRTHDVCEMAMGGFNWRNAFCCDFGSRSEAASYMMQGTTGHSAFTCGGPCCCGGPGNSPMHILRFHEGNE